MTALSGQDIEDIATGYDPDPARSMSLRSAAYTDPKWLELVQRAVFGRSWQWICHVEKLRAPGSYVAWVYDLDGTLRGARQADRMPTFDKTQIRMDQIQVEQFCGFVYVNLDPAAAPLAEQAPDLAAEIAHWAPTSTA